MIFAFGVVDKQLKDTILEGTNALAASLKEISGLMCVNECGGTSNNDVVNNALTSKPDSRATDGLIIAATENLVTPTIENEDCQQGDGLALSKRKRDDLAAKDMTIHHSDSLEESDLHLDAKKLKQDGIPIDLSAEQTSVPLSNERIDTASKEGCDDLTGWIEQNLCVKCTKDGQLLACSSNSCPLMVHENCLGSPAEYDAKGKFYCPFCAYSRATSEYLEAKKKASLARKELTAFMKTGKEHGHWRSPMKEQSHSRQDGGDKVHENGHSREQESIQANQTSQPVLKVNDHRCRDEHQPEPPVSCDNVAFCGKEANQNAGKNDVSVSDGGKMGEDCLLDRCERDQATANPDRDHDNQSCLNTSSVDQREAEGGIQKEVLQQGSTDRPETPVIAPNIVVEEPFESENDNLEISNYIISFRRTKRQWYVSDRLQSR